MNIRGSLDALILAVIDDAPSHGYAIANRLEASGAGEVAGGTLYPILKKLSTANLIEADWVLGESGPARKVYALTDAGRDALAEHRTDWVSIRTTLDTLLGAPEGAPNA